MFFFFFSSTLGKLLKLSAVLWDRNLIIGSECERKHRSPQPEKPDDLVTPVSILVRACLPISVSHPLTWWVITPLFRLSARFPRIPSNPCLCHPYRPYCTLSLPPPPGHRHVSSIILWEKFSSSYLHGTAAASSSSLLRPAQHAKLCSLTLSLSECLPEHHHLCVSPPFLPPSVCIQASGQTLCPHTSDSGGSASQSSTQRCLGEGVSVQNGTQGPCLFCSRVNVPQHTGIQMSAHVSGPHRTWANTSCSVWESSRAVVSRQVFTINLVLVHISVLTRGNWRDSPNSWTGKFGRYRDGFVSVGTKTGPACRRSSVRACEFLL